MWQTLLLLVSTLAFFLVSRGYREKSDYLTWKWHPEKIYTRFLCLSYSSIKLLLLLIELVKKWLLLSTSFDLFFL